MQTCLRPVARCLPHNAGEVGSPFRNDKGIPCPHKGVGEYFSKGASSTTKVDDFHDGFQVEHDLKHVIHCYSARTSCMDLKAFSNVFGEIIVI